MLAGNITYRPISALETYPLRRSVLHPDQTGAELAYPSDGAAAALHVGAVSSGNIVGVGSIWPSALPQSIYAGAWRIVGMAVEPGYRKRGIGSELLNHLLAHAARQNGELDSCNSLEDAATLSSTATFAPPPST